MSDAPNCPACREPLPADAPEGMCPACMMRAGLGTGGRASAGDGMPDAAEIERRLPQFEVKEVLGRGGMGVVWRARHRVLDRDVALKILAPDVAAAPGFTERFRREAKALARLDHPNIVRVHDSGEADGLCWLAMELVDGTNLRQAMAAGAIRPQEALEIVRRICDALEAAHAQGVVHRDIKPENVLLSATGHVKVADFGIAKIAGAAADDTLTRVGQVVGTAHYMAPEQVEHPRTVDHRADIYSLGVVFYELLTGELPIGRFAPPSAKVRIDVRLDEIVLRTLEKEREARYQRAVEVRTSVDAVGDGGARRECERRTAVACDAGAPHWTRSWATVGMCVAFAAAMWALAISTTHDGFVVPLAAWVAAAIWTTAKARAAVSWPWEERTRRNAAAWVVAGAVVSACGVGCGASSHARLELWFLPLAVPGGVLSFAASAWADRRPADVAAPRRHPLATRAAVALCASIVLHLSVITFANLSHLSPAAEAALRLGLALPTVSWILAILAIVGIVRSKGAWTGLALAIACIVVPIVVTSGTVWFMRAMGGSRP